MWCKRGSQLAFYPGYMKPRRLVLALAASISVTACSDDQISAESASGLRADSAGGLVIPPSTPYRPTGADASTALVVTLMGDSAPGVTANATCRPGAVPAIETVFWLDGIREGKPLTNERRYALVNGNCARSPPQSRRFPASRTN